MLAGTAIAGLRGRLPGCEPRPYIIRFTEDRPNLLYRRVCYTTAWGEVVAFAVLNIAGLVWALATGMWRLKQMYAVAYFPIAGTIWLLGALGRLPRVKAVDAGRRTRTPCTLRIGVGGRDRAPDSCGYSGRSFRRRAPAMPSSSLSSSACSRSSDHLSRLGLLPRTRPIVPGELASISRIDPSPRPLPTVHLPTDMAEGHEGWDDYAPFYDWENARTLGRRDVPFWRTLALQSDGPVLELGCGTGRISIPLARAGVSVVGIDRSDAMLARARQRIRRGRLTSRARLIRGDIRALPFGRINIPARRARRTACCSRCCANAISGRHAARRSRASCKPGATFGIELRCRPALVGRA